MARGQPEQLDRVMATNDGAQLAERLVRPLAGALQATVARSGAAQLPPDFVQDAVRAAAAAVMGYGSALINR